MRFVFRVDVSPLANYKPEGGVPAATKGQKTALWLFVIFMLMNVLHIFAPEPLRGFLAQFGIVGIAMMMGAFVPLLKDENGKPLGNLEDLLHLVNWGQIMMVGYIMVVSTQMMNPTTGISAMMANILKPFTALPPLVFIIAVMLFCLVLTNVANNMLSFIFDGCELLSYADIIDSVTFDDVKAIFENAFDKEKITLSVISPLKSAKSKEEIWHENPPPAPGTWICRPSSPSRWAPA